MYDPMDIDGNSTANHWGPTAMTSVVDETPHRSQNASNNKRKLPRKRKARRSKRDLSASRLRARMMNKGDSAQIGAVSSRLLVPEPLTVFANHCEMALRDWITLLEKTSLSNVTTGADPRIVNAFKELDNIIFGITSTRLLKRFAYF